MGVKPLHIRFDEIDGFIRIYDGIGYFVLFASERYNKICDTIRYHLSKKVVLQILLAIILQK